MKQLVLMRHAKAEQGNYSADFQRKLTPKGAKQAEKAGLTMLEQGIRAQLILASAATRTTETASIIARALNYPENAIRFETKLYASRVSTWREILKNLPETANCVVAVGHNPEISQLANELSPNPIMGMGTSDYIVLNFAVDSWQQLSASKAESMSFHTK